jgi:C-5 cytosine-specific DNA methylase
MEVRKLSWRFEEYSWPDYQADLTSVARRLMGWTHQAQRLNLRGAKLHHHSASPTKTTPNTAPALTFKMKISHTLTSVEICAGAGGQALGLDQAGFEHRALVEIEKDFCTTLRLNN